LVEQQPDATHVLIGQVLVGDQMRQQQCRLPASLEASLAGEGGRTALMAV
jgi:hypothetical protein